MAFSVAGFNAGAYKGAANALLGHLLLQRNLLASVSMILLRLSLSTLCTG